MLRCTICHQQRNPSSNVTVDGHIGPIFWRAKAIMIVSDLTSAWAPRLLSVLRIVTGLQFLEHGTQKVLSFPPRAGAAPHLASLVGFQGCLELIGGLLIVFGLFT